MADQRVLTRKMKGLRRAIEQEVHAEDIPKLFKHDVGFVCTAFKDCRMTVEYFDTPVFLLKFDFDEILIEYVELSLLNR